MAYKVTIKSFTKIKENLPKEVDSSHNVFKFKDSIHVGTFNMPLVYVFEKLHEMMPKIIVNEKAKIFGDKIVLELESE